MTKASSVAAIAYARRVVESYFKQHKNPYPMGPAGLRCMLRNAYDDGAEGDGGGRVQVRKKNARRSR